MQQELTRIYREHWTRTEVQDCLHSYVHYVYSGYCTHASLLRRERGIVVLEMRMNCTVYSVMKHCLEWLRCVFPLAMNGVLRGHLYCSMCMACYHLSNSEHIVRNSSGAREAHGSSPWFHFHIHEDSSDSSCIPSKTHLNITVIFLKNTSRIDCGFHWLEYYKVTVWSFPFQFVPFHLQGTDFTFSFRLHVLGLSANLWITCRLQLRCAALSAFDFRALHGLSILTEDLSSEK